MFGVFALVLVETSICSGSTGFLSVCQRQTSTVKASEFSMCEHVLQAADHLSCLICRAFAFLAGQLAHHK